LIASLLDALIDYEVPSQRGGKKQRAFDTLKKKIFTAPILALPDLHQPFEI